MNMQGNALLEPADSARAREIASLPRVKPRSLINAVCAYERAERLRGNDLPADFASAYWAVLTDPTHRAFPVVFAHYTAYVDPKARAIRAGSVGQSSALPQIVIVGPNAQPQTDVTQAATVDCVDITASVQPNAPYQKSNTDVVDTQQVTATADTLCESAIKQDTTGSGSSDARIDALTAQVAALTALVARLVGAQGGVASESGNEPLPGIVPSIVTTASASPSAPGTPST